MLVLENKKIIAQDTPINLYNNPKTPLLASFFGEFNSIEPYGIVYAHQLKIVKQSHLKAIVKQAYFNGNGWLIEALLNKQTVFFQHNKALDSKALVFLEISV